MKDEPAFKPPGNSAFFRVRASRCPFHLRQQTQGPSHLPVAEGSLPLWSLRKVGLTLLSKPGNQLISLEEFGCTELSPSCCVEIGDPLDKTGVSGNLWTCLKKSSHFSCMMCKAEWLWIQCRRIGLHLQLICSTRAISCSCGYISVLLEL